jgi:phage repressor protein C with HTH and peptisase S24 domain
VEGDSMAPTLNAGDDILVDLGAASGRLRDGIYVLRIDDAVVVKRLALNPTGRRVTVQSDNPACPDRRDGGSSSGAVGDQSARRSRRRRCRLTGRSARP